MLCEIIASRILRRFDEDHAGPAGLLLLSNILVAGFWPFQNAPTDAMETHHNLAKWSRVKQDTSNRKSTALEIAIISNSKIFLSSTPCQKVVEAIYQGRVVYTPTSYMDLLPDYYKRRPITLYDPRARPLLNQYRLIVPRTRNVMELASFVILLALYIAVMDERDPTRISGLELTFCIFAWGWVLDQFASMVEHGWTVYTQNLWAFLDVIFLLIFVTYFGVRMHAHQTDDEEKGRLAFHILASGAPVLIPRLAFNLLSENMLFVSLRAMMSNFSVLSLLAVWCFGGFLLALNWMGNGVHGPLLISKWMLYVWFGLDGTGVGKSVEFHWLLGPVLMVTFAFLGNTLYLTILVSMLSHTFSKIVTNATAEIQFRRAVLTFECVKADAIFAFFPPFNIPALLILLPVKLFLSPRWFHKVVVTAVRILNAPILLALGLYERRALWSEERARQRRAAHATSNPQSPAAVQARLERRKPKRWPTWDMNNFNVHADIQEVFETEPEPGPDEDHDEGMDEQDMTQTADVDTPAVERSGSSYFGSQAGPSAASASDTKPAKRRRDSMALAPFSEVTEHLHALLSDYQDMQGNGSRIEQVEEGLKRVEDKLDKLINSLTTKAGAGEEGTEQGKKPDGSDIVKEAQK